MFGSDKITSEFERKTLVNAITAYTNTSLRSVKARVDLVHPNLSEYFVFICYSYIHILLITFAK